jgi:cytochrome c oxidase cbb3-type subunit III
MNRLWTLLVLSVVFGGCAAPPADVRSSNAPAPVPIAIGPTPGPAEWVASVANPFSGDRAAAGEGRRLFNRFNCSGCHGDHAGGGMGPSLRDIDWIYGSEEARIYDSIERGRADGMPAWGRMLSQDQIWRLVTYLKTLRTSNEPEPPVQS